MFIKLIIIFTIVPLIELSLLIDLSQKIGLGSTLMIVILTGILGAYLARQQGFFIITKIQNDLRNGRIPSDSLIEGVLILAGGLLLVTPGLLTDAVGFSVLFPFTRIKIRNYLKDKFRDKFDSDQVHTTYKVD